MVLDVHPDRVDRGNRRGERRGGRHEVDVVGDVDAPRRGGQVVEHVVQDPQVMGSDRVSIARGELVDRLLLARGHERVEAPVGVALALPGGPVGQPHAVVKVDDVGSRDRAAAFAVGERVAEVGGHPDHEAVDRRLGHPVELSEDQVRPRSDLIGPSREVKMLHAVARGREGARGRTRHREHRYHEPPNDCSLQVPSPGLARLPGVY